MSNDATPNQAIQAILERALADPDFLDRFAKDPVATAKAEGLALPDMSRQEFLSILASSGELAEPLHQRLSLGSTNHFCA